MDILSLLGRKRACGNTTLSELPHRRILHGAVHDLRNGRPLSATRSNLPPETELPVPEGQGHRGFRAGSPSSVRSRLSKKMRKSSHCPPDSRSNSNGWPELKGQTICTVKEPLQNLHKAIQEVQQVEQEVRDQRGHLQSVEDVITNTKQQQIDGETPSLLVPLPSRQFPRVSLQVKVPC